MKKKIIIFTLVLLALFSIASVCAGDVDDTLTASEDDSQIELTPTEDNLKSTDENQVIGEGPTVEDNGSFVALQEKIDAAADNSTIVLPNNYNHENEFATEGILINKSLTIDGNGFTINANNIIITDQSIYFLLLVFFRNGILNPYIVSKLVMNMHAPVIIIIWGAIIAINGGNVPVFPNALNKFTTKYKAKHVKIPKLNFKPKV